MSPSSGNTERERRERGREGKERARAVRGRQESVRSSSTLASQYEEAAAAFSRDSTSPTAVRVGRD